LPNDSQHKNWQSGQYLLIRSSYLTRDQIAACPNLRAIGKQGVGTDIMLAAQCSHNALATIYLFSRCADRCVDQLQLPNGIETCQPLTEKTSLPAPSHGQFIILT
jgi:hypothetical protein